MLRTVYRVVRTIHPLFDGSGALRRGSRWTSPGRSVIYAAGSYAGALLEVLAHFRQVTIHASYHAMTIEIPEDVTMTTVTPPQVRGWDAGDFVASRLVGDEWLRRSESAVLQVPSMTGRPHEVHFVINPEHPDVHRLVLGKPHEVVWDSRLIQGR